MLSQTDAVKKAWAATDRTLDIIVTVDGKDYQATEINSLNYDAGAFTGDTLGIGSAYENSVTIEFSSVVEAFKQGLTVLPKVGILVNGKFEYTKLGTFIMSEVNRDRNNNLTTIKALDQMCKLEGQYKPTVSATASPLDIIADIANQGGVAVNTGELQHLPTLPNIKRIEGQTLRTAIGWIAQLYDGFAAFDRDGKLTIRTTASPDYTITPGEYQQGGLTKNEVAYRTGGIKVTVNTKKTDDSGQEVDDTTTLQAGETTGSQIELTNDSMTSDLLTTVWTGIKDITYYPYTLNWFGNPNLEAGDWVTLTDTQGNQFNVPVNQYTMTFNGGLESTISATQSSSTAGGYAYTGSAGSIKNMIEALQVRHTASGNNVYPPSYQGQPKNPKKGDVWYKQNGNNVEVWIYQEEDGKLSWIRTPLDGEVKAELQAMGKKTDEDLTRVKSELSSEAESQWESAKAATREVASDLSATKASLAAVNNDLSATKNRLEDTRTSLATAANDLTNVKTSLATTANDLAATKNSLETATSEFQKKTGQLSGSLSTANSKIEFNTNAIAEVKRTAGEISTTVSNIRVGGRNLLTNTRTLSDVWNGTTETIDGFTAAKATQRGSGNYDPIQWGGLSLKSNTDYVLTFYAKASKQTAIYSYLYDIGTDSAYMDGSTPNTLTTDYQRYTIHFHTAAMPAGRTVNCLPVRLIESGVTAWIYGVQLEEGNTATQWQPAPEDTDQAISKVSQTADAIRADLTNTKGDVASVKAKADSLTTQLSDANGNIFQLQQTAKGLQSTVAGQDGKISQLQHDADGLTATVANGGQNLIPWAGDFSTKNWACVSGGNGQGVIAEHDVDFPDSLSSDKMFMIKGNTGGNRDWATTTYSVNVVKDQIYTFSVYVKLNSATSMPNPTVQFRMWGKNLNIATWGAASNNLGLSKTAWKRISFTGMATATDISRPAFGISGIGSLDFAFPQFERGKIATAWSNSPGDIAQLKLTADGLTSKVADTQGNVSSLQQTATMMQKQIADNKGNISSVKNTADEVRTDLANAKGDISSLQQTASGLTSRVGNAEGNISQLQQTADRLSGVVGDANSGLVSSVNAIPGQISSAITASKQATVIESATDLHNMKTAGYYLLKGTLANSPVDAWAFLRVITSDSGDRIYHRIWKDNASTVYTEEWTGSWSDWATHINSDNLKSNVITAINQSTEGVSITGNKITLDGNVNVAPGFTLSADHIKAGTLSADRISGGTLNFSNITVDGLTANSISSGSISGQNLNINLDNGTVEFTKGNLHSTDGGFNISIDNKSFYLDMGNDSKLWINGDGFHLQESATQHLWMNKNGLHNYTDTNTNGILINDTTLKILNSKNAGLVAKDGMLQFSANPIWDSNNVYSGTLSSQLYGTIGFNSNLLSSSLNGIFIKGREGVVIGTSSYDGGALLGPDVAPMSVGSGINLPDSADKPASIMSKSSLTLFGGPEYKDVAFDAMADISIGCDFYYKHNGTVMYRMGEGKRGTNIYAGASNISFRATDWLNICSRGGIGRIALDANYVHSYPTYLKTTSAGANVYVAADGALVRSSSARKYKTDIQDADNDYGEKLIEFAPQKWIDKAEKKRYEDDPDKNKKPGYYYGLIADDLDAAGLDMLVNYGAEGQVEGINYDRLAVALLPVIKSLKDQVAILKKQVKALTGQD